MSHTFAIPDLHGRADLARAAIEKIETSDGGTVVWLGDYVDRGPDSKGVIDILMAGPQDPRFKWVVLTGNHERIMLDAVAGGRDDHEYWAGVGGAATLRSYGAGGMGVAAAIEMLKTDHAGHLDWLDNLVYFHEDAYRLFVHAGFEDDIPIQADTFNTIWKRYRKGDNIGYRGKHMVHGHTPIYDGPLLLPNRTNLDVCAYQTGRIAIGVFDDDVAGGPVEVITIQMDH